MRIDPARSRPRLSEKPSFRPRTVGDVMIRQVQVVSPSMPIVQAYETMMDGNFHHLPVVDERGEVVGVVSDRDVLQAVPAPTADATLLAAQRRLLAVPVEEVMTSSLPTVSDTDSLDLAIDLMLEHDAAALVVVDDCSRPVGVITPAGVATVLSRALRLARMPVGGC